MSTGYAHHPCKQNKMKKSKGWEFKKRACACKQTRQQSYSMINKGTWCLLHNLLLVDVVGPPSVEACRTVAIFPHVDDRLSIRARRRMKMASLKQPYNQIQEISCVPNTPNTMANCIGALVRRRDGDKSVILMAEIYFYNPNKKTAR